jgi:hypothetical protein
LEPEVAEDVGREKEAQGHASRDYAPGFLVVFLCAALILVLSSSALAKRYDLEAPLLALRPSHTAHQSSLVSRGECLGSSASGTRQVSRVTASLGIPPKMNRAGRPMGKLLNSYRHLAAGRLDPQGGGQDGFA